MPWRRSRLLERFLANENGEAGARPLNAGGLLPSGNTPALRGLFDAAGSGAGGGLSLLYSLTLIDSSPLPLSGVPGSRVAMAAAGGATATGLSASAVMYSKYLIGLISSLLLNHSPTQ